MSHTPPATVRNGEYRSPMAGGSPSQELAVTVLPNGHNTPNTQTHYTAAAYHPPLAQAVLPAIVAVIVLIVLMLRLRSALHHASLRYTRS